MAYTPNNGVAFDGLTTLESPGFVIPNTRQHLISFWLKIDVGSTGTRYIHANGGERYYCRLESAGEIRLRGRSDASGNPGVLDFRSNRTYDSTDGWLHVLIAWDVSLADDSGCKMYVNNEDVTDVTLYTQLTSDLVNTARTPTALMGRTDGSDTCDGALQEYWYGAAGQWLDLTVEANRQKFALAGKPVDLGTDGSIPLGVAPTVYFNDPFSSFGTNKGTGSNFSVIGGPLTDEGTKPEYDAGGPVTNQIVTSLDAALQAAGLTRTATLDAALQANVKKTADLNALLQRGGLTRQASLDAQLVATLTRTALLDALLQARYQKSVSLDAVVAAGLQTLSKTANLDAALQRLGISRQTALDAVLQAVVTKAASLDALLFREAEKKGVTLDALLKIPRATIGASFNALILGGGCVCDVTMDSLVQAVGLTRQVALNALLSAVVSQQVSFDGVVSAPPYLVNTGVDFANGYITTANDLSFGTDGNLGMGSMWLKLAGDNTLRMIFSNNGQRFYLEVTAGNIIRLHGRSNDTGDPAILTIESNRTYTSADGWLHLLFAWDVSHTDSSRCWMYVNDVDVTNVTLYVQQTTFEMNFARFGPWGFGALNSGGSPYDSTMQEFWLPDTGNWQDLSVEANRRKFSDSNGFPVSLGANGELPLGSQPLVYWNNPFDSFEINKASYSQANITLNGTLADEGTTPFYVPPGGATFQITATLDAVLSSGVASRSIFTALNALIQESDIARNVALDGLLTRENIKLGASLDALIRQVGNSVGLSFDSMLWKRDNRGVSMDALVLPGETGLIMQSLVGM